MCTSEKGDSKTFYLFSGLLINHSNQHRKNYKLWMTVLIQLICFELRLMNFCGTVLYTDYNFDKKLLVCEGLKDIKCRNLSHTIDIVSVSFVNTKS